MTIERLRIDIGGLVQGIGFRPFVYRLASQYAVHGWVANNTQGVRIEVQGERAQVRDFLKKLQTEKPAHARIHTLSTMEVPLKEESGFTICESATEESPSAIVLPDLAPCEECLREIFDPTNRRYRYPFTNCTNCGPRFSIVDGLPYDRSNTSMKHFSMCDVCEQEYSNPLDRRFHAEPNACPNCGPHLQLYDKQRNLLASNEDALQKAVKAINDGRIVALKSVGGFQLIVDAGNTQAVIRLREKKQRPDKPFALAYPDLDSVQRDCHVSKLEKNLLCSQERPIVLLSKRKRILKHISGKVAPDNPNLGIMLPCSPLHYLLLAALKRPVVATSGNRTQEPICYSNQAVFTRLGDIADLFLMHNRPVTRPLDDSIVRAIGNQAVMLRRARGYAPLPIVLGTDTVNNGHFLAVGGQLKNTVAVSRGKTIFLSQHIGDLENVASFAAFEQAIDDLSGLYRLKPKTLVHDLHPNYASTRWAEKKSSRRISVQHHIAHFFACMAEYDNRCPAIGVCWDGTGFGEGGTLRGGEFLYWDAGRHVDHIGTLRTFPLVGGEQAIREPRRQALGLLHTAMGEDAFARAPLLHEQFTEIERNNFLKMLERGINSPLSSSAGRLFDGVSALLGLVSKISFEGQAAMALEFAAQNSCAKYHYPFGLSHRANYWELDWVPMILALLDESKRGVSVADMAAAFHNTLAQMILAIAKKAGENQLFLSGGVFQNKRLTETTTELLQKEGFRVYCHNNVPPNDGGIALGQIYFAHCMEGSGKKDKESDITCV